METLDKAAMGGRIKQIRLQEGLRQWELARLLGTTQSAVHKYEHGVIPEPRRLMELARIGNTSIEWILTGRHWEDGSEDRERLPAELLRTARLLRDLEPVDRPSVEEALHILREAMSAVAQDGAAAPRPGPEIIVAELRNHAEETVRVLEAAWRIQRAILRRVSRDAGERLASLRLLARESTRAVDDGDEESTRR